MINLVKEKGEIIYENFDFSGLLMLEQLEVMD